MKTARRLGLIFVAPLALGLALAGCKEETTVPEPSSAGSGSTPATMPTAGAYPLEICVVSGEKLGSMGDPVILTHEGTEVRFCCTNCEAEFKKEPARFVAMVKEARASGARPATQPSHTAH